MHVLSRKALRQFWLKHPDAELPLRAWHQSARRETWRNFADVRARFPHADQVGRFTAFNIGGNKYRLIATIHYNRRKVFIRHVLTHKEYDQGDWKES
jgi:mRNA interferase HigB